MKLGTPPQRPNRSSPPHHTCTSYHWENELLEWLEDADGITVEDTVSVVLFPHPNNGETAPGR